MPSEQPTEAVMQQNLAHHERRNELLIDLATEGCFEDCCGQIYLKSPAGCFWSAEDLRLIADELDRRNK